MAWDEIEPDDALARFRAGAPLVDVRSAGEFAEGFVPGSQNIAILNDEHRHRVGLCYKQQGPLAARALGHKLVDPLREGLVAEWSRVLVTGVTSDTEADRDGGLLMCWRGGLRSQIACEWLNETGVSGYRVRGGYKAVRAHLLSAVVHPPAMMVLGGYTGSGKTALLRDLKRLDDGERVVDLELLANHRGSAFGYHVVKRAQPCQTTFENGLGLALWGLQRQVVVEDESSLIGRCHVPREFHARLRSAPLVVVESSVSERADRIFQEYVAEPLATFGREKVEAHLLNALNGISRRLGGLRTRELAELISSAVSGVGDHRVWIEALLREYYDPRYEFGLSREGRQVVFRGGVDEVREYLASASEKV